MQIKKIIGGVFLIVGTSIGGGMLGLPIVTAGGGILYSSILLLLCWALMTFTAFLTLEVNLCLPKNSNVISMVRTTLGKPFVLICWTVYLCFLYALLATYIAGGSDVLHGLFQLVGINTNLKVMTLVFVIVFGAVIVRGIRHVDFFNSVLMCLKLAALFLLILFIVPHVSIPKSSGMLLALMPAVTVAITSFGFSIIVPPLRNYFDSDVKSLRIVILVGSLIPLLCYLLWNAVIFSALPIHGANSLAGLLNSSQPLTGMLKLLSRQLDVTKVTYITRLFTSVCVLTAFLCVSLGLYDYLADGLKSNKDKNTTRLQNMATVSILTFVPPLICVLIYPRAFIAFLSFAGFLCVILQAFLPALMAWRARYSLNMNSEYRVFGGKTMLILMMLGSGLVAIIAIYQWLGLS